MDTKRKTFLVNSVMPMRNVRNSLIPIEQIVLWKGTSPGIVNKLKNKKNPHVSTSDLWSESVSGFRSWHAVK